MGSLLKAFQWTNDIVSSQFGKIFVITGANSGIGLEAARLLGYKDAKIILACRSESRAIKAIDDLVNGVSEMSYKNVPSPARVNRENLDFMHLDLGDLNSIDKFSKELNEKYPKIDGLICNAGIMAPNTREETAQGMEMQMGVNVFGHYALCCKVAPCLQRAVQEGSPKPRIVWVSSGAHKTVSGISFDDIDHKKSYSKWATYGESKLGNLLLMHKFAEAYPQFIVNGCHPGYSATNLQDDTLFESLNQFLAQSAMMGSLPTIMAAVDPNLVSNSYIGPYWNAWGVPAHASMTKYTKDKALADQLLKICEEKTSCTIQPL